MASGLTPPPPSVFTGSKCNTRVFSSTSELLNSEDVEMVSGVWGKMEENIPN